MPKQERGQARRALLVETACEVFLEKGYGGASLDDIIAKAGGSRRNVYEWFGGKEALFAAVVHEAIGEILASLSAPELETQEPREALIAIGRTFVETLVSPRVLALYRVVVGESGRFPELGRAFFEAGPKRAYQRLAADLRAWGAQGKLAVPDADLAARLFLEMMKADVHMQLLFEPEAPVDRAAIAAQVELAVDMLLTGIAPPAGRRTNTIRPRRA